MNQATNTSTAGNVLVVKDRDIISPTDRDVINGKGQGVQRLKGNVEYRKAVKAHKVGIISPSLCFYTSSLTLSAVAFITGPGPLRDVRGEQG